MTSVIELRDLLLGAGAFVGIGGAGLGAFRFFMRATLNMLALPGQMERCAVALEHSVVAMQEHNSISNLVVELRNRIVETRDEINRDRSEHDHFRREIRILARRMEGAKVYAQITS
jgi:hypothetical protein